MLLWRKLTKRQKQCALNIMAVVKSVAGSLENVERIVKVVGFVAVTPDFTDAPKSS